MLYRVANCIRVLGAYVKFRTNGLILFKQTTRQTPLFVQPPRRPSLIVVIPTRVNLKSRLSLLLSPLLSLIVMSSSDGRVGSRIENYSSFWQKDTSKEAQVDSDTRVENYTDVVNGAVH